MMPIVEVKHQIQQDPQHWEVPFMDFVDDFRYYQDIKSIQTPFPLDDRQFDALLASTVEYLCHELSIPVPTWIQEVPACQNPWFVSGLENLKAISLVESPLEFRIRKIFVLENFLTRV